MTIKENSTIVIISVILSVIISLIIGSMMNKSQKVESFNVGGLTVSQLQTALKSYYGVDLSSGRIQQIVLLFANSGTSGRDRIKPILELLSTNRFDNYVSKALKGDYDNIIREAFGNDYVQSMLRRAM